MRGVSASVSKAHRYLPVRKTTRTLRGTALPSREELKKSQAAKTTKSRSKDRDVGSALRTIYQKTVDETIPDDLLDLLGKLD
jgi:hypothetical protein